MRPSIVAIVVAVAAPAFAQPAVAPTPNAPTPSAPSPGATLGMFAYPLHKQDAAKQQDDETHCLQWAQTQTGIDPRALAPSAGAAPPATPPARGAVRGAARGAAGGAAVGAVAGSAGTGAAIGSMVGAARGRRLAAAANSERVQEQTAAADAQTAQLKQAYGSCIGGRGYSVK